MISRRAQLASAGKSVWRSEVILLAAMLLAVGITQRPYVELTRGDLPVYLQAKSFAELRLDIPVPESVEMLSADMALKDGHYYSHYPPGASLLLVPFYWVGHALDVVTAGRLGEHRSGGWRIERGAFVSAHLANLVYFAALFWLLRRASDLLGLSRPVFVHSAALLLFAAPFLAYSSHVSTQLPSTVLTLAATVLVFDSRSGSWPKLLLAGLAGALGLLVRPTNVILLAPVGVYVLVTFRRRLAAAAAFGVLLSVGALLTLWFNAAMFGGPFENGYVHGIDYGRHGGRKAVLVDNRSGFTLPFWEGFLGLTVGAISPEPPSADRVQNAALPMPSLPWDRVRGLLPLMPVILFGVPGFRRLRREGYGLEAVVLAIPLVALLLFYSKWLFWFASVHTPLASRYLCEGFPAWCLAIAAFAEHAKGFSRTLLRFTTAWSVGVQLLLVLGVYLNYFTGIDLIALETYKVVGLLLVVSGLGVWLMDGSTGADGPLRKKTSLTRRHFHRRNGFPLTSSDAIAEVRFRQLMDHATDAFFLHDDRGTILDVNRQACESLGYSREELIGLTPFDFDPDVSPSFVEQLRARLDAGEVVAFDTHHRRKDGTVFPVEVRIRPFWENARRFGVALVRDISDRKRAEELLRETTERLNLTLDHIAAIAYEIDSEGKWVLSRGKGLEKLGRLPDEVVGKSIFEYYRDKPEITGAVRRALEGEPQQIEVEMNGRIWRANYVPCAVSDGNRVYGTAVDITDLKRTEEALRSKTDQLAVVTTAMATFLDAGDWRQASALLLNAALKQTESEYGFIGVVVGGPVLRILSHMGIEWDKAANRDFYEKAVRTYEEVGYLEFTRFDNLFGRVITSGSTVISNDPSTDPRAGGIPPGHPPLQRFLGVPILRGNEVVGMIGVANRPGGYTEIEQAKIEILSQATAVLYDSYRRRQREASLEEQFRQAQKMEAIGRLAGGVAHDFNNLLTVILGYIEVLLSRMSSSDPMYEQALEIKNAGTRAAVLSRQLLAFSRRQVLEPRLFNINDTIATMSAMLRRLIGEDVDLVTKVDPTIGSIEGDSDQIAQVIMNLVVNARDAMPGGGQLTIESATAVLEDRACRELGLQAGPYVMLTITDTGRGMDEQTKRHAFEPFFTTKELGKGTGLGLSTVYGIIKQHGGAISVESKPGRGSTFTVYLPRAEDLLNPLPVADQPVQRPCGTETVLVVEDEHSVRQLTVTVLREAGYTVLEASNGVDALHLVEQNKGRIIHLLVTDVIMPKMNGKELSRRVNAAHPNIKVLFISGYTGDAVTHQTLLEPGDSLLEKPFSLDELAQKVREVLDAQ